MDVVVDAYEWVNEYFIVTVDPNGDVTVRNRLGGKEDKREVHGPTFTRESCA